MQVSMFSLTSDLGRDLTVSVLSIIYLFVFSPQFVLDFT